jgi:TPR repeat protein
VQDSVEALALSVNHQQRPASYNESRGNFYFFPPSTERITPLATSSTNSAAPDPETEVWSAANGSNLAQAYSAYLDAYPAGRYAVAAKIKLAGLKAAPAPAQPTPAPAQPIPMATPVSPVTASIPANKEAAEAYQRGMQFEKAGNFVEAIREFKDAAENGSAAAQLKMAVRYEFGFGVAKNQTEAIRWYRKAAELGNVSAKEKLQSLNVAQ